MKTEREMWLERRSFFFAALKRMGISDEEALKTWLKQGAPWDPKTQVWMPTNPEQVKREKEWVRG